MASTIAITLPPQITCTIHKCNNPTYLPKSKPIKYHAFGTTLRIT